VVVADGVRLGPTVRVELAVGVSVGVALGCVAVRVGVALGTVGVELGVGDSRVPDVGVAVAVSDGEPPVNVMSRIQYDMPKPLRGVKAAMCQRYGVPNWAPEGRAVSVYSST
jgi:hypothetical protein